MVETRREKLETVSTQEVGKCKYCNARIAWMESRKNPGKKYCVNIKFDDENGFEVMVDRYDFHGCRDR